jgi:hypothetical protein
MISRRIPVKSLLAIAVGAAAFFLFAPWRAFALLMVGRSTGCPLYIAAHARSSMDRHEAAIDRILRASRMTNEDRAAGIELWETPQGRYWIPHGRTRLLASLLADRERKAYGMGEHRLQLHDIVVDCGAKFGAFTREALEAGAARVVAVEAAPENLDCLRRNFDPEIAAGRVVVVTGGSPIIDVMTRILGVDRVDFIRMDLDGKELDVLASARMIIGMYRPRMEIDPSPQTNPEQIVALAREGWPAYRTQCGPCEEEGLRIVPRMIWFY